MTARCLLALALAIMVPCPAFPEPEETREFKSAYELQKYLDEKYRGNDSKWQVTMVLTNKRNEKRVSKLVRYRKEIDGLAKTLLSYVSPADVRGTATLTIEQAGDEDDLQWMYLPAMDKTRRIPAADKEKSWAGSDFSFEDLRELDIDDFDCSGLKTVVLDGKKCYTFTRTPKSADKSAYGKIEEFVRADILEPVLTKFYDRKLRFIKELHHEDIRQIDGIWTVMRMRMIHHLDKHTSEIITHKVLYNTGINDSIFSTRGMLDVETEF